MKSCKDGLRFKNVIHEEEYKMMFYHLECDKMFFKHLRDCSMEEGISVSFA